MLKYCPVHRHPFRCNLDNNPSTSRFSSRSPKHHSILMLVALLAATTKFGNALLTHSHYRRALTKVLTPSSIKRTFVEITTPPKMATQTDNDDDMSEKQSSYSSNKPRICIVGGGNAAHALAALLPFKGFDDTTMYCPYKDQADRINQGLAEQNGFMKAEFAPHNQPAGSIQGKPRLVSQHAADVIPHADVLILPLPSFTYPDLLPAMKPYLRPGQVMIVTPGQGGFDWFARDCLGPDLASQLTLVGLMPMPFNCRITEYGKSVAVQEFKTKYTLGVSPRSQRAEAQALVENLLGGTLDMAGDGNGGFLECTLYPINAIIHPARLYTLLNDDDKSDGSSTWQPGQVLPENPLFYEDFTPEAAQMMNDLNSELIQVGNALQEQGVSVGAIPHIFDWLACYVYNEPSSSNLQQFFQTNAAYKGFRCPLVAAPNGFVPDFTNRYFTEDISLGLVGYKGLAELANVSTPVMDRVIVWAQQYMNVEFLVPDGSDYKLNGKDVASLTNAPQRFGITSMDDLRGLYPKQAIETAQQATSMR